MRLLRPVLLSAILLILAACGDDTDDTGGDEELNTDAATSEVAGNDESSSEAGNEDEPSVTAAELAAPGPYPVGVTTRELPTGNLVEVWYPAAPAAVGATDTYAVRDFTPEVMRSLVPEEINDRFTVEAARDSDPADDGPFPLVLFSHGAAAFRFQSTSLTHHLASWGMVVASADHPTRNLVNLLGAPDDAPASSDDMVATHGLVTTDDVLGPIIDPDVVGLSGHSAGGGTILAVAADEEIDGVAGYVSYASGAWDDQSLPDLPSMFMAGELDMIAEPAGTQAAYDAASSPSWLLEFAASGHLAFSDLCAIGDGEATLIDLAEAAGLSEFLDDGIRRLGTDGCEPPNRPSEEVWPGVHQATTGFFRWVFGIDPEPVGVDAPAVEGVTVEHK